WASGRADTPAGLRTLTALQVLSLCAAKNRLIECKGRGASFPAPGENHGVGVAEPSAGRAEDCPAPIQHGARGRGDLHSFLRTHPASRRFRGGESHAAMYE